MTVRDPQPMDAGFEQTMLDVGVLSKFSSSHQDAMDDSDGIRVERCARVSARSCSGCAAPAIAVSGTADHRARRRRGRSRSDEREPDTSGPRRVGWIT